MALSEGQVQVGDLLMGPGTEYRVQGGFNPWQRSVRADQSGARAWGHGSWSGAEWAEETVVPIPVLVEGQRDTAGWIAAYQRLAAAFAPSHTDVELRWALGGEEYLMRGRPRMVEPDTTHIGLGLGHVRCAFAALDPRIYSAAEHSVTLSLPSTVGGLTVPVTAPVTVPAVVSSGRRVLVNAGTAEVGLRLRIDGPVSEPRVSLLTDAGTAQLRAWLELDAGQWLEIDTAARTAYLNGAASRRGLVTVSGTGWPMLPAGQAEIGFDAPITSAATLTVYWRDCWW